MKAVLLCYNSESRSAAHLMGIVSPPLNSADEALVLLKPLLHDPECALILLGPEFAEELARRDNAYLQQILAWERPLVFALPDRGKISESIRAIT